jgi:hypothetical protein
MTKMKTQASLLRFLTDSKALSACEKRHPVPRCTTKTKACALRHAVRAWRVENCLKARFGPYLNRRFKQHHWPAALTKLGVEDNRTAIPTRYRRRSKRRVPVAKRKRTQSADAAAIVEIAISSISSPRTTSTKSSKSRSSNKSSRSKSRSSSKSSSRSKSSSKS